MSKDSKEISPLDKSVKPFYINLVLISTVFTVVFSLIGEIFHLSALNNIANEIQFFAMSLGSSYAFLGSDEKLSRSNLLLLISGNLTLFSFFHLADNTSSAFDLLYHRGILTLIICLFSIRYVLFRICSKVSLKWMKGKRNNILVTVNVSLVSYFLFGLIYYFVLCSSSVNFIKISIFVIILVSAFYELVKIMYLSPPIEYVEIDKSKNTKTDIFYEILNADLFAWAIVIIMFYLYFYEFFNISSQTLNSFFSSIAQMFASIVGIIAAFSIFILQQYSGENEIKRTTLKNGISGFLVIYIFIIIVSVIGILVSNDITSVNLSLLKSETDIALTRDLIVPLIFEFSLLMFPIALLYLYAMIVTFLKFDDTSESVYELY
ncbi:hypothetical protein [Methanosarcina sp.]|uniref:hypothetical protein n=1 Tax=Methanosarcina sp. TaxID=2213 RepID=UPI003BB54B4E